MYNNISELNIGLTDKSGLNVTKIDNLWLHRMLLLLLLLFIERYALNGHGVL